MVRRRSSLAEQAYDTLKRDIISCKLRPGQLVIEGDLAAQYGMSKTPIREALNLLRREGFVQTLPRRGTLVTPIDVQDVQHTFLLRMLLEPEAAALAAMRATGQQLKALAELSDATDGGKSSKRPAPGDALRLNRQFHIAIAEASGIPRLAEMVASLHEEVERFYNTERVQGAGDPTGRHHHELVEAIVTGDPDRARTLMADSIRASRQHLIETLIEDPRGPGLRMVSPPA
jgi:DNA-binding GntR family transcriptional regulator